LARKTYARMKRLNTEGVIPSQKLDEASAQYKSAAKAADAAREAYKLYATGSRYEDKMMAGAKVRKARGAVAEVNSYLRENRLRAPNKGQITDIPVEEGELVAAGYPIMTIVDLSDVWVTFNVREDMLTKLPMGKIFEVTVPAIGKKPIKVKVNYISAMGNFATWRATRIKGDFDMKTFEVRAVPVTPVNGLRAGMSAVFDWNKLK
jgi:HlyD family secretion protein